MVQEIFRYDSYAKTCEAQIVEVVENSVELDQTVFYPLGGGQLGDRGTLTLNDGSVLQVLDTVKDQRGRILHRLSEPPTANVLGAGVKAVLDWERRYRMMRVHTCLHLLCSIIPEEVTGGSIRDDGTGRLDFNIPEPRLDKEVLAESLNALVAADHPVVARWISEEEMVARPELVRTMSVKPPTGAGAVRLLDIAGVDLQPCGGTHVSTTGEIGSVHVTKLEKKGKQNRRVNVALNDG